MIQGSTLIWSLALQGFLARFFKELNRFPRRKLDLPGTENYYPDMRRTGSSVKVIRMLVGEITTTPLKKTNVGVIVSGRHDLPSYARTFSLTSFEMLNSFAAK